MITRERREELFKEAFKLLQEAQDLLEAVRLRHEQQVKEQNDGSNTRRPNLRAV